MLAGRYRFVRVIGRGGMSFVCEAVDGRTGATVAVKIVRSDDPDLGRRLVQEARVLERVKHAGLVRLLDAGSAGRQTYLVMELVDGPTLADTLRRGPLGSDASATLGARLADALGYVHGLGVVHRDVKPSNILFSRDGRVRLGDFGISRLVDAGTMTVAGTTLGTVAYMAPEQLEDHQVRPSADIWSLGIVLLECLTGRRVYQGTPGEVVARRLAGPVPLPADLPVPWKILLSGMLDYRPDQRLEGAEVAALIRTAPFANPWHPFCTGEPDELLRTAPHDLTALTASPLATALLAPAHTAVAAPGAVTAPRRRPLRQLGLVVSCALLILDLATGVGVATGLISVTHRMLPSGAPGAKRQGAAGRSANGSGDTMTTSTTVSTTTTTLGTGPSALAALLQDLASGEEAGTLDEADARAIIMQAEQAVTDGAGGSPTQAASNLRHAAAAIAGGAQNGSITPSEGSTLQMDLSTLATALGLGAAGVSPTTQPGPSPTVQPGPGQGPKGHGH